MRYRLRRQFLPRPVGDGVAVVATVVGGAPAGLWSAAPRARPRRRRTTKECSLQGLVKHISMTPPSAGMFAATSRSVADRAILRQGRGWAWRTRRRWIPPKPLFMAALEAAGTHLPPLRL